MLPLGRALLQCDPLGEANKSRHTSRALKPARLEDNFSSNTLLVQVSQKAFRKTIAF